MISSISPSVSGLFHLAQCLLGHLCYCKWQSFLFFFKAEEYSIIGFTCNSVVQNPPANLGHTGDLCSIPWLGRAPGGGNGNSFHYSSLGNPMVRGASWATVHGIESVRHNWVTENTHTQHSMICIYHIFIHSSIKGHLGCFPVLVIVNNAATNTGILISPGECNFNSFG